MAAQEGKKKKTQKTHHTHTHILDISSDGTQRNSTSTLRMAVGLENVPVGSAGLAIEFGFMSP